MTKSQRNGVGIMSKNTVRKAEQPAKNYMHLVSSHI